MTKKSFKLLRTTDGTMHLTCETEDYDLTFQMGEGSGFDLDEALRGMKLGDEVELIFQSNNDKATEDKQA